MQGFCLAWAGLVGWWTPACVLPFPLSGTEHPSPAALRCVKRQGPGGHYFLASIDCQMTHISLLNARSSTVLGRASQVV